MKKNPVVSIIVITVNTPKMTGACLRSVIRNSSIPYELIVINNSRASAIRKCLRKFPQALVIQNRENRGFSKAANQGIEAGRGRYFCLLNTDTLVPPGWLERLVEAIQRPGVAAVGPASNELYGRLGEKPWPFSFSSDSPEKTNLADRHFQRRYRNKLESVLLLHGFCLLLSRSAIASIGQFDENYFFGLEDIDYCLQLRLRGYQLLRVHSLFVHHRQRASASPERRRRLVDQAERYFMQKWTTPLDRSGTDFAALLSRLNRQIPLRKKIPKTKPLSKTRSVSFPAPLRRPGLRRLLRTGFPVQTLRKTFLTRLDDLSIFASSAETNRVWNSLRGGLDPHRSLRKLSPRVRQQIDQMVRCGLVREKQIRPPGRCLVTVMMAAHQAELWIEQAIESVLAQRFREFELIVIDDGSLDQTAKRIRQYAWHPQIRPFHLPSQGGIAVTRNRILQKARGKYIAVCDADDIMLPGCLQRLVGVLEKNPRAAWVYADRLGLLPSGLAEKNYPARQPDGRMEFQINVIAHAGALIRREAMEEVGGYNESLLSIEDYDLALRIARRWKILALSGETHYLWRQHWESASRINPWAQIETKRLLLSVKRNSRRSRSARPAGTPNVREIDSAIT